jgi:oxygen-independent coproporphyrinogen-3 oxidase
MLIYIHIPFCDSKCSYCAFNSYVDKFDKIETYMNSLYTQLEYELNRFKPKNNSIKSLFIGGGTPSTVEPELYKPIFELIKPYLKDDAEITSEANPNSASFRWLEGMYNLGVNRISFGVQSFNDKKLKLLNRSHSQSQAIKAITNANKVGFKNISIDIIYATYGDTKELIEKDLEIAFLLPINHLSAYALTIEENTQFQNKPQMSSENLELTNYLFKEIEKRGFNQYEISNFGKYQSIHNKGYWEYDDYIGAGSGAVGKLKEKRFYPQSDLESYIKNPTEIKEELLCDEDIKLEKIFLGFRSSLGVDKTILNQKEIDKATILVDENKLIEKNNYFYNFNYLLADELALFIAE